MVLDFWKNFKAIQFCKLNNICYNNFAHKSSRWGVLALGLLLAVYDLWLGQDGPVCPGKHVTNPVLYAEKHLFQQLCPEIKSWGTLTLGLLLAVYGPGLGPDVPGFAGKHQTNPVLYAE